MKKACYSCGKEKELTEYHSHRGRRDGHSDICKKCGNTRCSAYAKTPGAKVARAKFWAVYKEKSREKLQDYHSAYQKNLTPKQHDAYARTRRRRNALSPRSRLLDSIRCAGKRVPTKNIITIEELMEMFEAQKGCCAISGVKMTWGQNKYGERKKSPDGISIDRIDNKCGYEPSNIRLVCWQVNVFKNCWTDEQMYQMAGAIVATAAAKKIRRMRGPRIRLVEEAA